MKSCLIWLRHQASLLVVLSILPILAFAAAPEYLDRRSPAVNPILLLWFLIVYFNIASQLKSVLIKPLILGASLGLAGGEMAMVVTGAIGFVIGLVLDADRAAQLRRSFKSSMKPEVQRAPSLAKLLN